MFLATAKAKTQKGRPGADIHLLSLYEDTNKRSETEMPPVWAQQMLQLRMQEDHAASRITSPERMIQMHPGTPPESPILISIASKLLSPTPPSLALQCTEFKTGRQGENPNTFHMTQDFGQAQEDTESWQQGAGCGGRNALLPAWANFMSLLCLGAKAHSSSIKHIKISRTHLALLCVPLVAMPNMLCLLWCCSALLLLRSFSIPIFRLCFEITGVWKSNTNSDYRSRNVRQTYGQADKHVSYPPCVVETQYRCGAGRYWRQPHSCKDVAIYKWQDRFSSLRTVLDRHAAAFTGQPVKSQGGDQEVDIERHPLQLDSKYCYSLFAIHLSLLTRVSVAPAGCPAEAPDPSA